MEIEELKRLKSKFNTYKGYVDKIEVLAKNKEVLSENSREKLLRSAAFPLDGKIERLLIQSHEIGWNELTCLSMELIDRLREIIYVNFGYILASEIY